MTKRSDVFRHMVAGLVVTLLVAACTTPPAATPTPGNTPAAGNTSTPAESVAPQPAANSSQALIAADVESGAIDLATALEYRAWALFLDARLPEKYAGSGSMGEDQSLLDDIAANLGTAPEAQRAELERYLLRPTDPQSPFTSAEPAVTASGFRLANLTVAQTEGQRCSLPRQWFSQEWSPDGSADLGFQVWACGPNKATVQGDLDTVIAAGSRLWPGMTYAEPDGMGLPMPDTQAANHGDNGKVDVYLVEAHSECSERRTDCSDTIPSGVAAAYTDKPLNCTRPGFPAYACSAYMLLGRDRVSSTKLEADFAHEFFHVLQMSHNGKMNLTWYHEASAVWAEWFFARESAKEGAYGHFNAFQGAGNRSLLWYLYGSTIQYEAWGWPLFQAIDEGPSNVFETWKAVEAVLVPQEVDKVLDQQLSFANEFRNFAVRNAQPAAYIQGSSTGLEADRWQNKDGLGDFPSTPHVLTGQRSTLSLGKDEYPARVDALAAQYDEYSVEGDEIRQIEIDISKLHRAENADLDVIAQIRGQGDKWTRFEGRGGKVKLCRDQPEQDVDTALFVVVSNHAFDRVGNAPSEVKRVDGNYTIESKDECDPVDLHIGGTITWTAQTSVVQGELQTQSVSGTADVVIHVIDPYLLIAERDDHSTYSYDYSNNYNCAASHEEGTLESYAGQPDGAERWDYSIAALNPGGPLGEDLYLQILMPDYCGPSMGGNAEPGSVHFEGFPDCEPTGDQLIARFDGVSNYVIDCDVFGFSGVDNNFGEVSGHVSGVLRPLDGPHPTPPYN